MSIVNHGAISRHKRSWCLLLAGTYFGLCGVSAVVWSSAWYELAGLGASSTGSELLLAVLGVMMMSLGVGALLVSTPDQERIVLKMLMVANIGDAMVVSTAIITGGLPPFNGLGFLLLDIVWVLSLWSAYQRNSTGRSLV